MAEFKLANVCSALVNQYSNASGNQADHVSEWCVKQEGGANLRVLATLTQP